MHAGQLTHCLLARPKQRREPVANTFLGPHAQGPNKDSASNTGCTGNHRIHDCARFISQQALSIRQLATAASSMPVNDHKVTFKNKAGQQLAAILRDTGSKEAVILCHGLASHKNGFHLPTIAEALEERGISSLRLDFNGCGESEGPFKYANITEEADDIAAAVAFLQEQGKKAAGLLGHSKGGSSVLVYAAVYGEIPRVVNASGRFDHKRGIKERFGEDVFERVEEEGGITQTWNSRERGRFTWNFDKKDLDDRMSLDMADVCSKVPERVEVLTIHGTQDETIPVDDSHSFAERLRGHRLVTIDGADHNYSQKQHAHVFVSQAVAFLTEGRILP